ncbi:uncharacterized protein [Procambarus clarkii]|uniref:uncharacterized protein isoform X3 n=1 Tax=Procambarus clarkii TaxID=6728 RepID=UPI0037423B3C
MVSTLHITLSCNQPGAQCLGRSLSCEETNLLGYGATPSLTATSRNTSLSTSSVFGTPSPYTRVSKPSSTQNLLAPTPYSPSSCVKSASWSPVRFNPAERVKNFGSQTAACRTGRRVNPDKGAVTEGDAASLVGVNNPCGNKLALVPPTLVSHWSSADTSLQDSTKFTRVPFLNSICKSSSASQVPSPSACQEFSAGAPQRLSSSFCQRPFTAATQRPSPSASQWPVNATRRPSTSVTETPPHSLALGTSSSLTQGLFSSQEPSKSVQNPSRSTEGKSGSSQWPSTRELFRNDPEPSRSSQWPTKSPQWLSRSSQGLSRPVQELSSEAQRLSSHGIEGPSLVTKKGTSTSSFKKLSTSTQASLRSIPVPLSTVDQPTSTPGPSTTTQEVSTSIQRPLNATQKSSRSIKIEPSTTEKCSSATRLSSTTGQPNSTQDLPSVTEGPTTQGHLNATKGSSRYTQRPSKSSQKSYPAAAREFLHNALGSSASSTQVPSTKEPSTKEPPTSSTQVPSTKEPPTSSTQVPSTKEPPTSSTQVPSSTSSSTGQSAGDIKESPPSITQGTSPSATKKQLLGDTAWLSVSVPSSVSSTSPVSPSTPWRHVPSRLNPISFQRFENSVQGGGGSKGVGGGVMEDGAALASVAARVSSSAPRKANSLPGYYSRGSSHQPSFREAFNTSKSPTPPVRHDAAPAAPPRGPTSPRATRVSALMPSVTLQQRQLQQQRSIQQQQQQQQQQQLQQQQLQKQQLQKQQQQHLQQQQQQQLQQQQLHQPHYQELQKQQQQLQQNQQQRAQQQQKNQQQQRLLQQQQHEQQQKQKQQLVQQTQRDQKQQRQQRQQEPTPGKPTPQLEKKKRSLLSGIFRRRKKEVSSSSSSNTSNSDSEEPPQRRTFLRRRTKKKEAKEKEPSLPPATADAPTLGNARVTADDFPGQSIEPRTQEINTMLLAENNSRRVRVATTTTGSLGRDTQPLGIPLLMPQPGKLSKIGVSASHDSLPVSLGSWGGGGSHASLGYYSGGGMGTRSSSTDTISKKERREALKARVERLRDKFKDTSSDEEKASVSSHSMYGSEYSLSKTNSLSRRTRAARTERFLRRKSQELETLRNETEKDRRNREVVQARIEEIQRVREFEAERNKINAEKQQIPDKSKPKWSAKLVYQESSEYESSVLLRTPSVSPAASPHMKAKFQGHIPPNTTNAKEAVTMRQKPQTPHMSVTVSLAPPSGTQMRRSFQDFETPFQNDLRGHRSASYDSNINRNSFLMQPPSGFNCSGAQTANVIPQSRSGQIPPAPPPRDRSRIMSPGDGRPMSFSFENLNHETQRPNSSQSSMSNFTKGSSPSPSIRSVPAYLGPRPSNQLIGQPPPMVPNRRSFSELELSPQQQIQTKSNSGAPPSRPAPPMYPSTQYRYTDQPPKSFQQNQCCRVQQQQQQQQPLQHTQNQTSNPQLFYTDQAPQYAKIVPISSVPPSPSSDYSSYMSDNSVRLQQANTIWRQREQEIKNKITAMQSVTSQVLSDSSRSNSPKLDGYCSNGVASSPVTQHTDDTYGIIESKKPRPPPLTLKQAESLSSLSGQSDVSSPVPKAPDSDSSQSSLAREKKKLIQNRPLSMVLEKSESGEKDSPPNTPKSRPQPPRRGSKQLTTPGREITKRQMLQEIMKHKLEHPQEKTYQKEFEEMYRKEKERLERSKCSNFEEALKELEEIYASLKLDSEDLLDRAERRDLPVQHQKLKEDGQDMHDSISETGEADSTAHGRGRSRTPKLRRAGVPDVKADDMHYRRCQQSTRNQPDVQKALQMTGSYLLVSAVHVPPTDIDKNVPKDPMLEGQPDIVYDDVSYRNIKQANSIKVIDPQPPFGIPLGPTTQGSPSDYLHVTPKENYRPKMIARKEPDITMDDLAFRNLRKEQRDQSNKEVNVAELDELLSEANNESPVYRRKTVRSASADRAHSLRGDTSDSASNNINDRRLKLQTPRRVKHQNEARRSGRFFGNDAVGDSETTKTTNAHSPRHNPSWLERAHLLDNKWDNLSTNNLSTSTETLTELSSVRAVSQPDIRQAIIREARIPPGGPQNIGFGPQTVTVTALTTATTASVTIATITAPKIVTVQTIQSAPVSPVVVERKPPYRPLDTIFNNKAKPFYLADAKPQTQHHQDHVDIAKLDALISTLSKIDNNEDMSDASSVTSKNTDEPPVTDFDTQELKIKEEPTYENVFEPQTIVSQSTASHSIQNEKTSAKVNIGKAIRLSMALESYSSEGKQVSSRRRSAIDLPLRDIELSHYTSSISPTNVLHCLNVNLSRSQVPAPSSVERVRLASEPQSAPAKASTCTDRVESMIVVSQNVHDKVRRSHSLPTSPRGTDATPVFNTDFDMLVNGSSESNVGEVVSTSECSSSNKDVIGTPHFSTLRVEEPLSEPLFPHSQLIQPTLLAQKLIINPKLFNACDSMNIPPSACNDAPPPHKAALTINQNVEHECSEPGGSAAGASTMLEASQPPLAEVPLPPVRSSSLPPSPALQRALSISSQLLGPPSPTRNAEAWLISQQGDHSLCGASVSATSSESDDTLSAVRAEVLPPPASDPPRNAAKGRPKADAPEPRSCSSGERDDHLDHDASPHRTGKGRSPLKEAQKGSDGERPKERQRRSESERHKPKDRPKERQKERPSEAEKLKERERKDKKLEYDRLKIGDRERQRAAKAQGSEEKERRRKSQEREKRKSLEDRERRRKSEERERRKSVERERKKSIEREKRRSEERDNRRHPEKQRQGEEREKRREKQRPENADDGRPGSPEKTISSSSSSNSSSSRRRMVQQKSSGAGAGGGSRTDLPEAEQAERAEQERRERIQRYKDERRKQIAARYGTAEWSSSEESGGAGEESSYLAYRRRRRRGRDVDTSSTELSPLDATSRVQENGSSLEGRGRRAVGGSSSEDVVMGVRSTRTSRLRHAALSSSSNNNNNNNNLINNNSSSAQDVARDPATPAHEKAAASPDQACHKRVPDQGVGGDSADSTLSGSDGRGGRRRRQSVEDRDKSHKRKSNLNRSANSEEPAADVFASLRPTDANEETPRRRRRRGPPSPVSASLSGAGAEPLKTPEVVCHVVSRLGPPSSPPTHPPAQPSPPPTRRHPSPQPTLPAHTFQPIQPALPQDTTHSAPSTLDSRSRFAPDGETRRVSSALGERSETEEGFVRKVPPKLAPLRKPEIPDVLRPKDTTGLASPGVVNTPPNSRPSSVVLEKPPLAPEGQRPAAVRSSLRKPSDTGTCFMAARREKRDETKPENIFRELQQRPRKGDRLSKSDMNLKIESSYSGKQSDSLSPGGSDLDASGAISSPTMPTNGDTVNSELMSSRLEALTARARETIERVDRLANDSPPPLPETSPPEDSADNVVHECEEYLTVNASRKESTVGVRPRETSAADSRGDRLQAPAVMKGVVSDTGQKNWVGGSEGRGKESKRVAMEKEMNRDNKRDSSQVAVQEKVTAASAVPSGPPDHGALINDNIKPPPEEVVHGLQHEGYDDEDLGSPDSSQIRSPDHRSNKRSSRRCSLDGDTSRTNSPDPHSILKRRSSREDVANDRPTTPEPHSILKRKTSSRASSIDTIEGEPRPILKKKSSIEELDHFEPRPILKKKSSTDDELDDRPRSILKGGRSREDLDRVDCVTILKRSPRCDSEGEGELRPILKRRETTDGVRLRLHVSDGEDVESEAPSVRMRSDSAPEAVIRIRGRSPPAPSATPSHGILKKRGAQSPGRFDQMDSELGAILRSRRSQGPEDNDKENDMTNRPVSPSLVALIRREDSASRSGERPLSVAERVAGMEAGRQEPPPVQHSPTPSRSPGARPKVTPSFFERPQTPTDRERENRRNSAFGLVADPSPVDSIEAINEAFLDRPVVEAYNSAMSSGCDTTPDTPSSVSQRAAFFAQLEREQTSSDGTPVVSSRSTRFSSRRDRGTRHATQPVTDDEVSQAARLADASDSASASHDSDSAPPRRGSLPWKSGTQGDSSSSHHSKHKNGSSNSVGARVALWTKRLEEERLSAPTLDGAQAIRRRSRSARFKTQPVTLEEVAHAHAFNSQNVSTTTGTPEEQELASGFRAARDAVLRNAGEVMQGLTPGSSPRRRPTSRKTSLNEPDEEYSSDPVRGILKRDGSGGSREAQRDSPRSILKHSSSDSRRASFSESEHPRGILKSDSPLPPSIGSPEHEAKLLRGVLKKDSSLEDSKEIKSILKPESESLEPDHSSDSSSDDVTLTTANTPQGPECDIAESIRDIDPIRHKDDSHKSDTPHKVDPYKTEHHRADLAEALRQVEPIKSKDDLAEALRQIEPIHSKERSREKEDKGKDETQTIGVREFSSSTKATSSMTTMVTMAATVSSSSAATTNSSSSTSESEHKTIKNETVVRRRNTHSRRYDERRSMVELRDLDQQEAPEDAVEVSRHDTSESSSSSDSADGLVRTSRTVHTRSCVTLEMDASQILQQSPIFKDKSSTSSSSSPEQSRSERGTTGGSSSPSVSINARLAALQRSGEDGWKNRVKKEGKDVNSNVTLRPKPVGGLRERPVSLMDRMSALETSSQQWRGRITQSDATKFTVAHKMASSSTSSVPSIVGGNSPLIIVTPEQPSTPIGSPLLERKKRSPCQKVFKSKTGGNLPALLNKSSPLSSRKDFRRSISTPNDGEKRAEILEGTSVSVPRADDESFTSFFSRTTSTEPSLFPDVDVPILEDADFDLISETASQLVVKRRSVRVTRRQVASRNPLKTLAAREDLKSEYTEVKMGVGERELRRMKVQELSKGSPMAVEALAGLASRENFSAVALKKVESTPVIREMAPYTSLMLLQIKGRRHAQTRLVEPIASSINQGDDFVLITPTDVYHYKGEFSNVIERAKAAEIAQYILQKKDMGVTSAKNLVEMDENSPSGRKSKFWKLLGGDETSEGQPGGLPDEDEYVEAALVAVNKVYEVQDDSLVPLADSWGQMPKIEILVSDKVLVFDFGSELYIWAGKRACSDKRKVGLALGRELWEEQYDYSECDINPIVPMTPVSKAKMKGSRPEWGMCAKLTENVETILFKEKFIDWPDLAQQSRIKEVKKELDRHVAPVCELQPCDAKMMLEELPLEPDLVLEMSHLGRGVEYYDEEERRLLSISTNDFKVWHVSEYGKVLMDATSHSHLHAGDTYVVRWYYLITATGRTLKGEPSKHNVTGRSRVAYFFWQGRESSVSDKGVSALMTVELDEERGPHVRVSMGMEPPAFLNLFQGGLVIHQGHKDDDHANKQWKLFVVRGEMENEGHLVELEVSSTHLRSRGCLILANMQTGVIHLWHGAKALKHTRKVGSTAAQKLSETSDIAMGWKKDVAKKIKEQYEGAESREFWEGFGGSSSKNKHFSLLEDDHSYDWTPRVWQLEPTHDSFQATEVICSYRATSLPNPLPVLQLDLYSVPQPALFLVDACHRVWVWQGWWPDETSEGEDFSATGSAVLRFNFARRAALETALSYCKLKAKAQAKAIAAKSYKKVEVDVDVVEPQLVVAGLEPLQFTNIFPTWTPRPDVTAIQEKEGRWKQDGQYLVSDILAQLSRTEYSFAELIVKPLPDGVDPLHLEVYLGEEEFTQVLGMGREEFYSLQSWKQTELKKKAKLF